MCTYPKINMKATGENIRRLRITKGYSVRQLQSCFGFDDPQAIYRWQWGKSIPSIDNLVILSVIFHEKIDSIIVVNSDDDAVPFYLLVFLIILLALT
jgi:transcriptional regulator with XRE-family HTH domain